MSYKVECRKFNPNIFNKIKCSNCFRQREEHSAEALESNRASRKVSKCGYLFVAPDWDFSIPLYRTKRWQRRWFVLYDDGQLTYSVDDLPATIPQSTIDMNRVLEVSHAEDVTGNKFSLAIVSPDRATFVKGTCREETMWWLEVLQIITRTQKGRHKRNATFPGIKTSSSTIQNRTSKQERSTIAAVLPCRNRFHSCASDSFNGRPSSAPTFGADDVFPVKQDKENANKTAPLGKRNTHAQSKHQENGSSAEPLSPISPSISTSNLTSMSVITPSLSSSSISCPFSHSTPLSSLPPNTRLMRDDSKENTPPPYSQDYPDHPPTSESPPTQDKVGGHRPRARRTLKKENRFAHSRSELSHRLLISDLEDTKRGEMLKDIADSITRPLDGGSSKINLVLDNKDHPTRESEVDNCITINGSLSDVASTNGLSSQVRGNPDGCVHDVVSHQSSNDTQRVDLPAEDILYIKKGWLLKLGSNKEWNKYWFVLQGNGLRFYREQSAEEKGILDGIVDLSCVQQIQQIDVERNYGFQITTWSDQNYTFSAVTCGIRANWIQALRNAANLCESKSALSLGLRIENELKSNLGISDDVENLKNNYINGSMSESNENSSTLSISRCSVMSSDYETALEQSMHDSKDISRGRITSRFDSTPPLRSRSSPPPSRRGTRDEFPIFENDIKNHPEIEPERTPVSFRQIDNITSEAANLPRVDSVTFSEGSAGSMRDLNRFNKEQIDPSTSGEAMLVDLLETQVESLKAKLEQTQASYLDLHKEYVDLETKMTETKGKKTEEINEDRLSKSDDVEFEFTFNFQSHQQLQRLVDEQQRELSEKNSLISDIESALERCKESESSLKQKVKELNGTKLNQADALRKLNRSIKVTDSKQSVSSSSKAKTSPVDRVTQLEQLNSQLQTQIKQQMNEIVILKENRKSEKSEVYKWKDLVKELHSLLDDRNQELGRNKDELVTLKKDLEKSHNDLEATSDRLKRGIEENESLYHKIREMGGGSTLVGKSFRGSSNMSISLNRFNSKRNLPRLDSLSDLTNFDSSIEPSLLDKDRLVNEYFELRLRFEKTINEILYLKKELREGETKQDDLDLANQRLKLDLKAVQEDGKNQVSLMSTRIQDLTSKLNNSEKQGRALRQKVSRCESREKRRSQSLRGRESFSFSRDMESKLSFLEARIEQIAAKDGAPQVSLPLPRPKVCVSAKRSKSFEEHTESSRLRRKSLDGGPDEAVKAVLRLTQLEEKVSNMCGEEWNASIITTACTSSTNSSTTNLTSVPGSSLRSLNSNRPQSPARRSHRSPRGTPEKTYRTRSDSELKLHKERIVGLEKLVNTLQSKISECLTCLGMLECSCSCNIQLSNLDQHLKSCNNLVQSAHSNIDPSSIKKVQPVTQRLFELLKDKMSQLVQRKNNFKANGKWTRDTQLKLFAEKISFETLLLSQLAQALLSAHKPDSYESSLKLQELIEAHRKLSFLEKTLTNPEFDMEPMTPLEFYTNLLAEKLVVQGDVMSNLANETGGSHKAKLVVNETCKDLRQKVLEREKNVAALVTQYKEEKLHEIAVVMARQTVTEVEGVVADNSVLLEEVRLREAWAMAREILHQELVNLEASQSIMRLSHLLGCNSNAASDLQINGSSFDRFQSAAEDSLRQEIEESVFTLSNKYEQVLAQYRGGNTAIINSVSANMEQVLGEFASVVTQKAMVDGQLSIATGDDGVASVPLTITEEKVDTLASSTDVVASETHLLMFLGGGDSDIEGLVQSSLNQSEFAFLYNKMNGRCINDIRHVLSEKDRVEPSVSKSVDKLNSLLNEGYSREDVEETQLSKIPPCSKAKKKLTSYRKSRRLSDITGMVSGSKECKMCDDLKEDLTRLQRLLRQKSEKSKDSNCKKCTDYVESIKLLKSEHASNVSSIESQHKAVTDRLRDQVRHDPPTRDSDDELTELKRRLCLLEEGYENQIAALKKQYDEALDSRQSGCEETIRIKYQREIEHLRGLCEKGLVSLEASHKSLLKDLEAKHEKEVVFLKEEKEQALQEETRATLAALDAMRKAHQAEVIKEVAKFKEEFLRKRECAGDASGNHIDDLKEARMEILQLSQKFSEKCLELAEKDEKIQMLNRSLREESNKSKELNEKRSYTNPLHKHKESLHVGVLRPRKVPIAPND